MQAPRKLRRHCWEARNWRWNVANKFVLRLITFKLVPNGSAEKYPPAVKLLKNSG